RRGRLVGDRERGPRRASPINEERDRLVGGETVDVGRQGRVWQGKGRQREDLLAAHVQDAAARDERLQPRRGQQEVLDQAARGEEVFEVVDHQQKVPRREVPPQ